MRRTTSPRPEQSDEALLEQFRNSGDLEFLGRLYDRYLELLYGLCLKYLQEKAAAEDAVMGIFEELTTKALKHDIQNFRSWLYVVAKNYCLMQLRRQKREITVPFDPHLMQSVDSRHHIIEAFEENGEEKQLRDCLDRLSGLQKRCIHLFYFEEKSYKEIAEDLSLKLGKVRSNIQNGRRNLRICMEEKKGATEKKDGNLSQ